MIHALSHIKSHSLERPHGAELRAGRDFEAVLMTSFLEQILPENLGGTNASQAGSNVWRSFMAQAVAEQLASQNITGIASLAARQLIQINENSLKNA